jgi:hypothetical protein
MEIMRLTQVFQSKGRVGIGTTNPTAQLHTTDSVRHQNLLNGSGNYLVIDANGYVWRSNLSPNSASNYSQNQELIDLKKEVETLKKYLELLTLNIEKNNFKEKVNANSLEIIPNPFNMTTKVKFNIVDFKEKAVLQISNTLGTVIKLVPIAQPKGQIELNNIAVTSGNLIFTIVSNGKSIISKNAIKL